MKEIIDYELNSCIERRKYENKSSGRKQRANRPIYRGGFRPLKGENSLPIQPTDTFKEKARFYLQTVGF